MATKPEYLAIFSEEAGDQLREWEECLLALDRAPGSSEPLNDLFRAIHTLKGSAGFIGFDGLQKLAHELEAALAGVRDGSHPYDGALGDLLFQGLDLARCLIEAFTSAPEERRQYACDSFDVGGFLARLAKATDGSAPTGRAADTPGSGGPSRDTAASPVASAPGAVSPPRAACAGDGQVRRLAVRIDGQNREAYLRSCLVKARLDRMGAVLATEPSPESLRESTEPFIYTVTVASGMSAEELVAAISIDQVTVTPAGEAPAPSLAEAPSGTAPRQKDAAPSGPPGPGHDGRPEEVVRVSVQKLDRLLNLVGELVIHNSGFRASTALLQERLGGSVPLDDLEAKSDALTAITRELQDGIMKARMLPIGSVFARFHRVVRDLAKASGKAVRLEVFGEETEIDKKVIDRIGEPLVHLVRNAVDHGLEPSPERTAAGKPAQGTIRLGAFQEGDHICVEVSDDGRGLDREAILRTAIEKSLIDAAEAPRATPEQILGFIFLPGFSTAKTVSDISGRGVGMDAVKRAVDELSGSVRVRSSPGAGTTVAISLPLTMAIITAVLVEAAGSTYAVPISAVREIVKPAGSEITSVGTRRVLLLRGEVLALANLAAALRDDGHLADTPADPTGACRPVVVVDFEGRKIGLEVDGIMGSREVVIKSLSRHYREVEGLIGASILGDGRIALIVDVESMIRRHHHGNGNATAFNVPAWEEASPLPGPSLSAAPAPRAATPEPALETGGPGGESTGAPEAPLEQLAQEIAGPRGRLLEDVHNQGAVEASVSLSQLMGQEVRVSFPESRLVPIRDVAATMGGEEGTVGGLYISVQGDLEAGMLLVIPEENLRLLNDLLNRAPAGTTIDVTGVDLSGITELGNILASSFINAIADASHLSLKPEVPEASVDMCLSVIDSVLARFNQPGDRILVTEAVIYGSGSESVVCHQVLFLEPPSLRRLMDALAARSAEGSAAPRGSAEGPAASRAAAAG